MESAYATLHNTRLENHPKAWICNNGMLNRFALDHFSISTPLVFDEGYVCAGCVAQEVRDFLFNNNLTESEEDSIEVRKTVWRFVHKLRKEGKDTYETFDSDVILTPHEKAELLRQGRKFNMEGGGIHYVSIDLEDFINGVINLYLQENGPTLNTKKSQSDGPST